MFIYNILKMDNLNFRKLDNIQWLIPAIIQDYKSNKVLMLWFMNDDSYKKTIETWLITFFSRTKNRLWTKWETSWNYLLLKEIKSDCDNDTLLILVKSIWPTCHTWEETCFWKMINNINLLWDNFMQDLFDIITDRKNNYIEKSYTCSLFTDGLDRIAQKVWEEAIETVIASKNNDGDLFIWEVSDLIYHLFVLLVEKWFTLDAISRKLKQRHMIKK